MYAKHNAWALDEWHGLYAIVASIIHHKKQIARYMHIVHGQAMAYK